MRVLVDLDGTLLDISSRYYQVYAFVLHELGCRALPREVYWELKREGTPIPEILERSRARQCVSEYVERRLALIESPEYLALDRLVPRALDVLGEVARSADVHLVTLRRDRAALHEETGRLGMAGYFSSVLSCENRPGKWTVKRDLIARSGVLRGVGSSLIVGDTEGDILSGRSLGILTCAVLNGIRTRQRIVEMNPDYIIEDIRGLPAVAKKASRRESECQGTAGRRNRRRA